MLLRALMRVLLVVGFSPSALAKHAEPGCPVAEECLPFRVYTGSRTLVRRIIASWSVSDELHCPGLEC